MRRRNARCCRPPLCKSLTGVYPYIVAEAKNYEVVIPYFHVQLGDGTQRKSWLVQPSNTGIGDAMRVRTETVSQSLGCGVPPRVRVMTSVAGIGNPMVQGTPVYFQTQAEDGLMVDACTESAGGNRVVYSAGGSCEGIAPTTSWFQLSSNNPDQAFIMLGNKLTPTTSDGRVLRALATLSEGEYELAWRQPASTEGFPVTITLVANVTSG